MHHLFEAKTEGRCGCPGGAGPPGRDRFKNDEDGGGKMGKSQWDRNASCITLDFFFFLTLLIHNSYANWNAICQYAPVHICAYERLYIDLTRDARRLIEAFFDMVPGLCKS